MLPGCCDDVIMSLDIMSAGVMVGLSCFMLFFYIVECQPSVCKVITL